MAAASAGRPGWRHSGSCRARADRSPNSTPQSPASSSGTSRDPALTRPSYGPAALIAASGNAITARTSGRQHQTNEHPVGGARSAQRFRGARLERPHHHRSHWQCCTRTLPASSSRTRRGQGAARTCSGLAAEMHCRWRCPQCQNTYLAAVQARVRGNGCPDCGRLRAATRRATADPARSLRALLPDIAAQYVENIDRPGQTPDELNPGSHARCRWRCPACGQTWIAPVASRLAGHGCPPCGRARLRAAWRRPRPGESLADTSLERAAQFVANLSRPRHWPGRHAATIQGSVPVPVAVPRWSRMGDDGRGARTHCGTRMPAVLGPAAW